MTTQDSWDLDTLHPLKTRLFTSPASAFDPFASPVLFFRSPGLSIPSYFPGLPPPTPTADGHALLGGLSLSEEEITSLREKASTPPSSEAVDGEITVSPKSNLRFPPRDSGLRIPRSLLLTTSTSPSCNTKIPPARKRKGAKAPKLTKEEPQRQADELARLMRRSVVMHEFKDRALWDEDGDPHAASEERVQVCELKAGEGEREIVEEWIDGLGLEGPGGLGVE